MQAKKPRFRPASYKTAEGLPDGIVTKFIKASKTAFLLQIERTPIESGKIRGIANSYRYILKWIESQDEGTREKFKSTKNRVRFQAESQIIKDGKIFDDYFDLFHLDSVKLNRRMFLRKKLIEFAVKVLTEPFLIPYIRSKALKGLHIDYSKVTALQNEFERLLYEENPQQIPLTREQEENILRGENLNDEPEYKPEPLSKQERHRKLLELTDQIGEEINIRNKEKRKPENLCYFLLYDVKEVVSAKYWDKAIVEGCSQIKPDDIELELIENPEKLKERISDLSRSNLIQFIRIYCEAHNNFYKDKIYTERTTNKTNMNNERKKKKAFTSDEKRGLIDLYKSCKITQKELARELDCDPRTVRRLANG